MKTSIILAFSVTCGFCFGVLVAAGFVTYPPTNIGTWIGGVVGALLGFLASSYFALHRNHPNIHFILIACFLLSFPAALTAGYSANVPIAILLIVLPIFSTFYLAVRRVYKDETELFKAPLIYVIPLACAIIAAAFLYGRIGQRLPDDVPSLIRLMGHHDESVHMGAANKLKAYGEEPFLEAIKDSDPRVRERAAHFLGFFKKSAARNALVEAAHDADPHVKMWVAFSLGEIGEEDLLPTLRTLANDKEEIVRRHAAEAIEKLHTKRPRVLSRE